MTHTIQQGDVLLRPRPDIIDVSHLGRNHIKSKRLVLAQGEATGHAHVLEVKEESDAELIEIGGTMLLHLENAGVLTHEEHKPVEVPAGTYQVGKAQEYDYAALKERQVHD